MFGKRLRLGPKVPLPLAAFLVSVMLASLVAFMAVSARETRRFENTLQEATYRR